MKATIRPSMAASVLKQNREDGRVLAEPNRLEISVLAFDLAQLLKRNPPGHCFEYHGQAQDYVVNVGAGYRVRVQQLVDPFVDRHPRADTEDQDRHHERPEVELDAVTERMKFIGGPGSALHTVKQQSLVAGIDERMNGLTQHRRTASINGGGELGYGDQSIARERSEDDLA